MRLIGYVLSTFVIIATLTSCTGNTGSPTHSSQQSSTIDERLQDLGNLDRTDKVAALKLAIELGEKNEPMALAYIGSRHLDGDGVEKDRQKAEALFEEASRLGDAKTDFLIGKTFARCKCDGNKEAAFAWYSRSAKRGYLEAQYDLGGMHELGFGTPKDPKRAFLAFKRAAELGHPGAMAKVSHYYKNGIGVKKDLSESEKWQSRVSAGVISQSLNEALRK